MKKGISRLSKLYLKLGCTLRDFNQTWKWYSFLSNVGSMKSDRVPESAILEVIAQDCCLNLYI